MYFIFFQVPPPRLQPSPAPDRDPPRDERGGPGGNPGVRLPRRGQRGGGAAGVLPKVRQGAADQRADGDEVRIPPHKFPIETISRLVGINILAGVRMLRSRLRMNPEPSRRHLNLKGSQIIVGAGRERKEPLP